MEIKKEDLDRIVITSNEQMQKIIDWYQMNQDYLKQIIDDVGKIDSPIDHGLLCLEEECIRVEFHGPSGICECVVYMEADPKKHPTIGYVKMFTFKADLRTPTFDVGDRISIKDFKVSTDNMDFPQHEINRRVQMIKYAIASDKTVNKVIYKLVTTLFFMLFNEEIVEIDHSQDQPRTRRVARAMKIRNQPLSLVRKTYVIKNFDPKKTKIKGAPRKWTAPDREVAVRGHYRHLKSGKVVWVRECTKFKEKGNRKPKEWKM